jgi:malonyl-CoA decarboxylase
VHEIHDWEDLRRRIDPPDRRCYAFFHPALNDEPLIFVEVALTRGLAAAVQPLLAQPEDGQGTPPEGADTAIFYSISNCQDGLRGISFGNFLIKQVVEELKAELPELRRFATLSPVPGFRRWLEREQGALGEAEAALLASERWWEDPERSEALREPLLRLAALYLTRGAAEGVDPVARFHLGNGARLERINHLGNTAPRGIAESWGIMVNYLYDPDRIEANHEAFVHTGQVVRSAEVEALLRKKPRPRGAAKPGA